MVQKQVDHAEVELDGGDNTVVVAKPVADHGGVVDYVEREEEGTEQGEGGGGKGEAEGGVDRCPREEEEER